MLHCRQVMQIEASMSHLLVSVLCAVIFSYLHSTVFDFSLHDKERGEGEGVLGKAQEGQKQYWEY